MRSIRCFAGKGISRIRAPAARVRDRPDRRTDGPKGRRSDPGGRAVKTGQRTKRRDPARVRAEPSPQAPGDLASRASSSCPVTPGAASHPQKTNRPAWKLGRKARRNVCAAILPGPARPPARGPLEGAIPADLRAYASADTHQRPAPVGAHSSAARRLASYTPGMADVAGAMTRAQGLHDPHAAQIVAGRASTRRQADGARLADVRRQERE